MPTPTGLPKVGETWRYTQDGESIDVVVLGRSGGAYWSLTVRLPDGKERLWVDATYYLQVGKLTHVPKGQETTVNTNSTDAWVALDQDGHRVKVGDKIYAANGSTFVFRGISHAPGVGSSGKILASRDPQDNETDEYYPRYFDLTLGYKPALGKS